MCFLLLLALSFLQAAPQQRQQEVRVPSQIRAVTVFQRGAQVTRTAAASVPAGTTALVFAGLPAQLDPESVQFQAEGALTVLSVVHRLDFLSDSARVEETAPLRTRRELLADSLRATEMQLQVYDEEERLLLDNRSLGGTSTGVDIDELRAAADFFRFIGYESITAPITSDRIDFVLTPGTIAAEEVVVTAERPLVRRDAAASAVRSAAPPPVQQVVQPTTVSFVIDHPYTVPSDGQPYLVRIEQYDVPAVYEYFTAPKLDPSAFLTAHLTGWEDLHLLTGRANLFFGDTFVGQSLLDVANVEDTLTVSLGRDESIVVRRTRQETFRERNFLGSRRSETVGFSIEVRNTKRQPVRIVVEDQIPLSTDERIDVDADPDDRAVLDEATGLLRWRLDVPPASTETASFRYTVTYPRGQRVLLE